MGADVLQHVVVIGAGIVGAAIACSLRRAGAAVTVIDAGLVAGQASGRSFGWINASFFADEAHFWLRAEGIAAWHRLQHSLGGLPISWQGCLWWEEQGAELEDLARRLQGFGYPVRRMDRTSIAALEPHLGEPPAQALHFPGEAAAETGALTRRLLGAATADGARLLCGVAVNGLALRGGRIVGVETAQGMISADQVVVAAGTGGPALLAPLGLKLPMLPRPAVLLTTQPVAPLLGHIMVAPQQEFRQMPDGRLLASAAASHQSDDTAEITEDPGVLADMALARLRSLLPGCDLSLDRISLAMRPVPGDGLPVIGRAGPDGLYVSIMHSGVTLAAVVGERVATELLDGKDSALLSHYRPGRFAGKSALRLK